MASTALPIPEPRNKWAMRKAEETTAVFLGEQTLKSNRTAQDT